jgi:chemotaxis protein methyltransferase CheR
MTEHLSSSSLAQLSEFVADQMGFYFPRERWLDLERGMRSVSRAFEFDDMESCVQWLVSLPPTRSRIETLARHLTVGETYFLRDRQSFDVLEAQVLPELINRRRATERRLRIWSAGCCTGEEPYSIAILLKRVIPDLEDWQITVLATDINPHFLNKAADGVYGEWSFRSGLPEYKERYFLKKSSGRFEILPEIKRIVTFSYLNLMEDSYPSLLNNTNAMDIIFCRNVLMYFGSEQAKQVVRKLHLSLLDGGWLVVSPCETSQALFEQFATVSFPATILYKKDNQHISVASPRSFGAKTHSPVESTTPLSFSPTAVPEMPIVNLLDESIAPDSPKPAMMESEQALYERAVIFYEQGCYEEAAQTLLLLLARDSGEGKAASLLAHVYANQGKLTEASRRSEQAVAADRLNPSFHILQAAILQEQGAIPEAVQALQRALYLEPNLVSAHFALGNIARRQGKVREAFRHFENARTLLGAYKSEQALPEFDGMTAGRLLEIIRSTAGAQVATVHGERMINPSASTAEEFLRKRVKDEPR